MKKIILLVLFFLIPAFINGEKCDEADFEREAGCSEAGSKILIISSKSDFKKAVIDELVSKYEDQCSIKVVLFENADKKDLGNNDAVIIIMENMKKKQKELDKIIKDFGKKENIILFVTKKDDKKKVQIKIEGVDSITSASIKLDVKAVVEQIIVKLDKAIKK